jgi:hypothetical protein
MRSEASGCSLRSSWARTTSMSSSGSSTEMRDHLVVVPPFFARWSARRPAGADGLRAQQPVQGMPRS